jgi:two-component system chemotaxis sensor kinase CheA
VLNPEIDVSENDFDIREFLDAFLTESREIVAMLDQDLLALESSGPDPERVDRVFRGLHTLKGTSGFFDLPILQALSHAGEDLVVAIRTRRTTVDSPGVLDSLLDTTQGIRSILDNLAADAKEGVIELESLLESLRLATGAHAPKDGEETDEAQRSSTRTEASLTSGERTTIRVNVGVLDELMNLVGELVLTRNQLMAATNRFESNRGGPVQKLASLTRDLRKLAIRARLLPVGTLFEHLPRVVRDMSKACNKNIELVCSGAATELDRSVIEAVQIPLSHLIRNAIDHGLEDAKMRKKNGKPAAGQLLVSARSEGNDVWIEVADDGRGIDIERVGSMAVEADLVAAEELKTLSDNSILRFIFSPGFSTADKVTNLSGRGMGMDIIRTEVERIGGAVTIGTSPGQGTTVSLRLPLTVAISAVLLVETGGGSLALPQRDVREILRLPVEKREGMALETRESGEHVLCLGDRTIPVIHLAAALQPGTALPPLEKRTVVLVRMDNQLVGLLVTELVSTLDVVVKPLPEEWMGEAPFTGATIDAWGRVLPVLDVRALVHRIPSVRTQERDRIAPTKSAPRTSVTPPESHLLCTVRGTTQVAVPLTSIESLSFINTEKVHPAGEGWRVARPGGDLDLVHLCAPSDEDRGLSPDLDGECCVIVCTDGDGRFGLLVERPEGIIDLPKGEEAPSSFPASRGMLQHDGQPLEILHAEGLRELREAMLGAGD